ncbi:MAG: ABC transporter ATP-binding protein [Chloroflexota bacterium]
MTSRTSKFLSYYKPYRRLLVADLFAALMISGIAITLPLCARHITKNILEEGAENALAQIIIVALIMLGLVAIDSLCRYFVDYHGHMMGANMERDMRQELFDHYQTLSLNFYDNHKTGQLMTHITTDIYWLAELFHHVPEDIIITFFSVVGTMIVLLIIDVQLALMVLIIVPIMVAYAIFFNRHLMRAVRRSKDKIGDINAQIEDTLNGMRVVKAFTNESFEAKKFKNENLDFVQSRGDHYHGMALFFGGTYVFGHLMTISVIVFGSISILFGNIDLADLVTFLLYVGIFTQPIYKLIANTQWWQDGFAGFSRFMDALEIQPDITDAPSAKELTDVKGHIAFKNVSFCYDEQTEMVIKNLSLEIEVGEYVAIVGASGIGKSTLCALIPRFYDVQTGDIAVDGNHIKDVTIHSLRKNIGYVPQDVYLFAGTIYDNIRYGNKNATKEQVIEAAKQANAHEFILSLPDGYDTYVGQRGVKLSGGQKQRISIARVFLKNAPILIFDEATSSLDNESEYAVQESLERLANDRTTIVIAHRLSTIRNAKRIIVLDNNGVVEEGTHDELMLKGDVYANLYEVQLPT